MQQEPDILTYDGYPEGCPVIFKPNSVQRLTCVKVGDPIDCKKTDCETCEYEACRVKQQVIVRKKWLEEHT